MIRARDVEVRFDRTPVLLGVDLDLEPGSVVGVIGPNGSGKTTLLRTLYRSLHVSAGEVVVDGRVVADVPTGELARRIAVVPQEAGGGAALTVQQMVLLGRSPHLRPWQAYRDEDHRLVADALHRCGLTAFADRPCSALSGGEQQRTLIARALVQQAGHLLLDEPTNHLDIGYQHEIMQLVRGLATTVLMVLHDLNLAARYCDRLVLLEAGRVLRTGAVEHVLDPELLGRVYGVRAHRVDVDGVPQLVLAPM